MGVQSTSGPVLSNVSVNVRDGTDAPAWLLAIAVRSLRPSTSSTSTVNVPARVGSAVAISSPPRWMPTVERKSARPPSRTTGVLPQAGALVSIVGRPGSVCSTACDHEIALSINVSAPAAQPYPGPMRPVTAPALNSRCTLPALRKS